MKPPPSLFDSIGKKLQLRNEDSPPFDYFGQITDSNGVKMNQFQEYVEMASSSYIDRIVRSHLGQISYFWQYYY